MIEKEKTGTEKTRSEAVSRRKFIKNAGMAIGSAAMATGIGYSSSSAKEGKKDCEEKP